MMSPRPARFPFWMPAVLLIVASLVYCAPLFSNIDRWGRQDWDQFMFRYETPRVALLRDHVLPAWNPYANGGTVLLAHPDSPVLSPWYVIVLALGSPLGLRVQVVVFLALGALGMAALLARLGARTAGSITAGLVFMMSSHFALHITEGHLEWCVLGLMPWLALLVLRFEEGPRHMILAAVLLASVLTFGAVYIPAVYLPFFSLWVLFAALRARQWRPLLQWTGVVLVATLLSSVKLLPMMAFTSDWPRDAKIDQRTPARLVVAALIDPRQAFLYQVQRDRELEDGHFARTIPREQAVRAVGYLETLGANEGFQEYGCYIGLVGIVLALLGGIRTYRQLWPLYAAGAVAGVVVLGASSPVDLWSAMRRLPLYHQLQVPSRFLAALVFVFSVAAAFGMTAVADALRGSRQKWLSISETVLVAVLYAELVTMGWSLFRDVFVIPPARLETHADFAHRFSLRSRYPVAMQSTMYGYLLSNSGSLDAYENLEVVQGKVLPPDDWQYRGEAYMEQARGTATILAWTMSKVTVRVGPNEPDRVILNQNFYRGWRARRWDASGAIDVIDAERSDGGLIAVPVERGHTQIEVFYVPAGFAAGAWISGMTLAMCFLGLWFAPRPAARV